MAVVLRRRPRRLASPSRRMQAPRGTRRRHRPAPHSVQRHSVTLPATCATGEGPSAARGPGGNRSWCRDGSRRSCRIVGWSRVLSSVSPGRRCGEGSVPSGRATGRCNRLRRPAPDVHFYRSALAVATRPYRTLRGCAPFEAHGPPGGGRRLPATRRGNIRGPRLVANGVVRSWRPASPPAVRTGVHRVVGNARRNADSRTGSLT